MRSRLLTVAMLAVVPAGATAAPVCSSPLDRRAAAHAGAWLATVPPGGMAAGQLADSITALRAVGRRPAALRSRLRLLARRGPAYARTPGTAAKIVLAVRAGGYDPRRFGRVDYLRRIKRGYAAGRYGASAYDQALAIIALKASGERVPRAALGALRNTQGPGGWGFALRRGDTDQVDATGIVLEALDAAGVPDRHPMVVRATKWMLAQGQRNGGFAVQAGRTPDANSTAAAWRGACASGRRVPARTRSFLRSLQRGDGRVGSTRAAEGSALIATNDAIIAFQGKTSPTR